MTDRDKWLHRLSRLRVDRSKGDLAPHKPLLVLVVFDMAEEGILPQQILPLTPELAYRFVTYWSVVAERRTQPPYVRYPFHHLKSDGLWSAHDVNGKASHAPKDTHYVHFDSDLAQFVSDPSFRNKARRLIIATYFEPHERATLYGMLGIPIPDDDELKHDLDLGSIAADEQKGRSARFRLQVVNAYRYTCALTGHRLMTISASSLVEAAHIHRFADSLNNDVSNGLALTRNAHWAFDEGLWSLDDDYRVIVAVSQFIEECSHSTLLQQFVGERIALPDIEAAWPDTGHLRWHRERVFRGS